MLSQNIKKEDIHLCKSSFFKVPETNGLYFKTKFADDDSFTYKYFWSRNKKSYFNIILYTYDKDGIYTNVSGKIPKYPSFNPQ